MGTATCTTGFHAWVHVNFHCGFNEHTRGKQQGWGGSYGSRITKKVTFISSSVVDNIQKIKGLESRDLLACSIWLKKITPSTKSAFLSKMLPPIESEPPSRWYLVHNPKRGPLETGNQNSIESENQFPRQEKGVIKKKSIWSTCSKIL